jgi:hypothetical protein
MSIIADARKLYDIRGVLGLDGTKKTIVCPLPMHSHQHNTPSFSIFTRPDGVQYFRCHGSCGEEGDVVDLAGFLRIPGYNPKDTEMVKRAITILQGGYQISPPQAQRVKIARLPYDTVLKMPEPDLDILAYADERGLTEETLRNYGVRKYETMGKKFMAIPTFHYGTLMGIKLRNIDARTKWDRFQFYPGSATGLFNYGGVFANAAPVLIVKAEIPAMLLLQHGIHACAPSGSENVNRGELFQAMAWAVKRIVVKDNDEDHGVRKKMDIYAGERAKAFQAGLKAPPDGMKDIDQWVLAEGERALETIRGWLR